MKERIRELAEQAFFETEYDDVQNLPETMERFAELIVREVFAKIEDERFEIYQPVKESVMKHFGVKE
jgi:hypothetical protein